MDPQELNSRIVEKGKELLRMLEGGRPSLFEEGRWVGKIMAWSLKDEAFRVSLLRFIDVFPSLSTPASLARHLTEYFDGGKGYVPAPVCLAVRLADRGHAPGAACLGWAIRHAIEKLARQFIVGESGADALRGLSKVRREGCAFSVDVLGEAVVSEDEAEQVRTRYIALLDELDKGQGAWPSLGEGMAEDPAFFLGPVCDHQAQERILMYMDIAGIEGKVLYAGRAPGGDTYVPITIVGDIRPEARIAQEEIFGPLLAVMRVGTFEEALQWANSTRFALTGGVFSRSPSHLEEAKRRFRVGNLYLNRRITGALVGRQPFGGFRMSGLGTKAGGEDYLLRFMDPRVVTENTARRGFAPDQ